MSQHDMTLLVLNRSLDQLGILAQYTAFQWTRRFYECDSFKLWLPLEPISVSLARKENLIWTSDNRLGVIETVEKSKRQSGDTQLVVSGRSIECWLARRTVWDAITVTNATVTNLYNSVIRQNVTHPTITNRIIPFVRELNQAPIGANVTATVNKTNVLSVCEAFSSAYMVRFAMVPDIPNKALQFTLFPSSDRSMQVVISTDLNDILEASYKTDDTRFFNVALVGGEDSGAARVYVTIGGNLAGLDRREMFVDARDIQSERQDGSVIPRSEYEQMLYQRGVTKLSAVESIEAFDAIVRTQGKKAYTYGVDYLLGDRVTMVDTDLDIVVTAEVTEEEEVWDENGYQLSLVFGNPTPTLNQRLKEV